MYPLDVSVNTGRDFLYFFVKQEILKASWSALKQTRAAFKKGGHIRGGR